MNLNQFEILFYSLAMAFCWVELVMPSMPKWTQGKPLNCLKCMTGWFSLPLAMLVGYGAESVLIGIAGVFIGAIAEGIIMRWL